MMAMINMEKEKKEYIAPKMDVINIQKRNILLLASNDDPLFHGGGG